MDTLINSGNVLLVFALGVIATIMLTNKQVQRWAEGLDEKVYAYTCFGIVTFLAVLAGGPWALSAPIVAFLAYQTFGRRKFTIPGLHTDGRQEAIDDIIVHFIDQRDDNGGANKRMIVEAVEAHPELLVIFDPKPTAEEYVTDALVRLLRQDKVEGDENGRYFATVQKITAIRQHAHNVQAGIEPAEDDSDVVPINETANGGAQVGGPEEAEEKVAAES